MSKKKVYVLKTTDLDEVAGKALEILSSIITTEQLGNNILLKPNAVGPYHPSKGVTTTPGIIKKIKDSLLSQGYKVLIGDCPGESAGTTERIFEKTGILEASGDSFVNLGQEGEMVDFPCRKSGSVVVAKAAIDADVVISMAKLKTSCFMMFSAAVKNYYGIVPGTQKALIHSEFPKRDDFADMLIDLASVPKRTMAIIDGSTIMEGNGPVHGDVRTENIYIISEDVIAADYAVAKLLGLKINESPILKRAQEREILNPEDIDIVSDVELPLNDIKLPVTLDSYLQETTAEVDRQVEHIGLVKIAIDKDKCIRCGNCARVCPAHAITMDNYPVIDHDKCIRCFCCNELCPVGAAKPQEDIKKLWDEIMGGEAESDDSSS